MALNGSRVKFSNGERTDLVINRNESAPEGGGGEGELWLIPDEDSPCPLDRGGRKLLRASAGDVSRGVCCY